MNTSVMKKISIIVHRHGDSNCVNCVQLLQMLKLPLGWQREIYITDGNVTNARQNAQESTEANIKIYVDDNVWLLDENIIIKVIDAFEKDNRIALVGIRGTNDIPSNGVASESWSVWGESCDEEGRRYGNKISTIMECQAVFGGFMALSINTNWHSTEYASGLFYDTAVTLDLRRNGYKTVIIPQDIPNVCHHIEREDIDSVEQKKFLDEYSKDIFPLVSIIIPTYCRPHFFEQALKSALQQTYRNIEIFITDNSPDRRTADIIAAKYQNDERIKYEYHPEFKTYHGNLLVARKYNNPQAEYVQWLMDDDILLPHKLSVMVDIYRKYPTVALVTSYRRIIDKDGKELPDSPINNAIVSQDTIFDGKTIGQAILTEMMNFIGEPTTVLIKKKYLHDGDLGWTGKEGDFLINDFPTWLNLCEQGDVVYLRNPASMFRLHDKNQQMQLDMIFQGLICWAMMIMYAWEKKVFLENTKILDKAILKWFSECSYYLKIANQRGEYPPLDSTLRKYVFLMSKLLLESKEQSFLEESKNEA